MWALEQDDTLQVDLSGLDGILALMPVIYIYMYNTHHQYYIILYYIVFHCFLKYLFFKILFLYVDLIEFSSKYMVYVQGRRGGRRWWSLALPWRVRDPEGDVKQRIPRSYGNACCFGLVFVDFLSFYSIPAQRNNLESHTLMFQKVLIPDSCFVLWGTHQRYPTACRLVCPRRLLPCCLACSRLL